MKTTILAALLAIGVAAPALAVEQATPPAEVIIVPPNPAPSRPGAYAHLSPGQQAHARALFDAQVVRPHGPAPMTLDQIATLRGRTGWGNVFKTMKAEGLVTAKNFGQVVRATHRPAAASMVTARSGSGRPVTMVDGRGRLVTSGATARPAVHARTVGTSKTTTVASNATAAGNGTHGAAAVSVARGGAASHGNGGGPKH